MDEIIIRSLQGRSSPAEEESLREWRQASLVNERYYREMARTWRLAGVIEPVASAADRVRIASSSRTHEIAIPARRRKRGFLRGAAFLSGAAAALVAGLCLGLYWPSPDDPPRFAAEEFITGPYELVTTRLSDGTVVRLAPKSRLHVSEGDENREVWLDGHAFFAVARNDGRPFIVRTRAGDAVVLGTRFDVQVQDNGMQVFVVEGRVAHHAGGQEVQVGAMEISRVTDGSAPAVQPIEDASPLLSWLGEFLVFQSTPIKEVARELERRFAVQVRVADEKLAERTVTAWFTNEDLEEVVLIVCRAADVRCLVRDGTVSIEP
jgi:transmembrane sensor